MTGKVVTLLRERHASRAIAPAPLDEQTIEELIEAVRLTPSCFNNQPWRFLFITGEKNRAKAAEAFSAGNRPWAGRAALVVVASASRNDDCKLPDGRAYYQFDLGMAVMNLMLAATDHGLVARPMAGFKPDVIREAFDLAPDQEPLVMLAIGMLSDDESHVPEDKRGLNAKPRVRKSAAEIVRRL